jgi:hypothetical protein
MRVTTTFRAPDDGEDLVLLTCSSGGEIDHLGRLTRVDLTALLPLLRQSVGDLAETGHPDGEAAMTQLGLLNWLEMLVRDGQIADYVAPGSVVG